MPQLTNPYGGYQGSYTIGSSGQVDVGNVDPKTGAQIAGGRNDPINRAGAQSAKIEEDRIKAAMAVQNQQFRDQGYNVGEGFDSSRQTRSGILGEETQAERYLNQQQNYMYGRDPGAADAAVAAGRDIAGAYAGKLSGVAEGAYGTAGELQNRATPGTNYMLSDASRAAQMGGYDALMAAGQAPEGPSAAQAQLTAGTNQAMAQQLALARSGRGAGESASAMRGAAFNQAGIGQNMANQSAMLRANEDQAFRQRQIQAFDAAGGLASNVRGSDLNQAQFLTDAELRSRQINDSAGLGYTNAALAGYGTAGETAMSGEEMANAIRAQQLAGTSAYEGNLTDYATRDKGAQDEFGLAEGLQTGVAAAGTLAMFMSDIRAKQDIQQLGPGAGRGLMSNYQLGAGGQQMVGGGQGGQWQTPGGAQMSQSDRQRQLQGPRGMAGGGQQMAAAPVRGGFASRGQQQQQQGMAQAAGAALSDRRAKEAAFQAGVEEGLGSVGDAALETVKEAPGYSYQYRDPDAVGATPGTHYGPMAQDLENTPMGSSVVSTGEDGMKRVDTNRLALINTAALNAQQKEIDALKRKRRAA